jgi:hypothetical protein
MMAFPNKRSNKDKVTDLKVLTLAPHDVIDKKKSGVLCNKQYVKYFTDEFNEVCNSITIIDNRLFLGKAIFIDPPTNAKVYRDKNLK